MMDDQVASPSANAPDKSIYLVLLVTLLAFGMGLQASFHFDDYSLFSDPVVTSSSGWWQVWLPLRTRPLTYLTFWINYQLGGQNPAWYHAVNLALHLYAVWLLYGILCRLTGERAAILATAIFALHPIQSEPVLYVFERATLLATVFCLLCWRSWLDRRYWSAVGLFALAVLGKEECVSFPFFLWMFQRAVLPAAAMLGLALAAGVRVIVSHAALHVQAVSAATAAGAATASAGGATVPYFAKVGGVILGYFRMTMLPYLCTQGCVILHYFRLLLVPYGFTVDPDFPAVLDWRGWLAWTLILGTAALVWKRYRHGMWFAAGLLLLLPSSSIFPAADTAADRRLYLPMVAFAALAGLLLKGMSRRMLVVPLALGLAAISFTRTKVWLTEQALWSEAVARSPRKLRPLFQLSRASGPEAGLRILDQAQALAPNDSRPAVEKGLRLLAMNRSDQALAQFDRALALSPNDPEILNNHGVALTFLGQPESAAEDFRRALSANPCMAIARRNLERLGITYPVACPPAGAGAAPESR